MFGLTGLLLTASAMRGSVKFEIAAKQKLHVGIASLYYACNGAVFLSKRLFFTQLMSVINSRRNSLWHTVMTL